MTRKISYHLTKVFFNKKQDTLFLDITKRTEDINTYRNEALKIVLGEKSISRLRTALNNMLVSEEDLE